MRRRAIVQITEELFLQMMGLDSAVQILDAKFVPDMGVVRFTVQHPSLPEIPDQNIASIVTDDEFDLMRADRGAA